MLLSSGAHRRAGSDRSRRRSSSSCSSRISSARRRPWPRTRRPDPSPDGVGGPRGDAGSRRPRPRRADGRADTCKRRPSPTPAATPEPDRPEPTPAATPEPTPTPTPAGEPVPYLITFAPGTSDARQLEILDATGATDVEAIPQLAIRSITSRRRLRQRSARCPDRQRRRCCASRPIESATPRLRPTDYLLRRSVVAAPDRLGRALRLGGHRRHGDGRDPRHRRPGQPPRPRRRRPARLVRPCRREPADRSERPRHLDGRHRRGRDR